MLPSRFPPKRTPKKVEKTFATAGEQVEAAKGERVAKAKAAGLREKLYVDGVAAALGLTASQVRMRVHREQWDSIPKPEPERAIAPGGGKYFWYADKVAAFKLKA